MFGHYRRLFKGGHISSVQQLVANDPFSYDDFNHMRSQKIIFEANK